MQTCPSVNVCLKVSIHSQPRNDSKVIISSLVSLQIRSMKLFLMHKNVFPSALNHNNKSCEWPEANHGFFGVKPLFRSSVVWFRAATEMEWSADLQYTSDVVQFAMFCFKTFSASIVTWNKSMFHIKTHGDIQNSLKFEKKMKHIIQSKTISVAAVGRKVRVFMGINLGICPTLTTKVTTWFLNEVKQHYCRVNALCQVAEWRKLCAENHAQFTTPCLWRM